MIKGFSSKLAKDIYNGANSRYSRSLPKELHDKTCRLLDQLNAITLVETLQIPPSNHLEKLRGKLKEFWSIRINKQSRIIFKWNNGHAEEVDIIDYH
jgi:proteic killer suppression protein